MAVALRVLAVGEETLRHNEVKIVLGARHRDIEQTPFFLDLGGRPSAEVGGNAAIDDVEHEDGLPFLALGGMDRRKDQVILVEQRHACLVARRVQRIEREFGQETLPGTITVRDLLELDQIGVTCPGILVDAVEMRFMPEARPLQFRRPPRSARVQTVTVSTKAVQSAPARVIAGDPRTFAQHFAIHHGTHLHVATSFFDPLQGWVEFF